MTEELKYEFNLSDPESWTKMERPFLSESFVKETEKVGGLNRHGKPRFKWVWGCSEEIYVEGDNFIQSGWYLKYHLCTTGNKLVGFKWQSDNGKQNFVDDMRQIPAGVLNAIPVYRLGQVGTPRWVLEEWRDEGDCNGMYDRSGYYFHRWIVADDQPENPDTLLKPYREPNQKDLDILAQYVQLTATLTDADIKQGVAADRAKEAMDADEKKVNMREEMTESFIEMFTDMKGIKLPEPSKADVSQAIKRLNAALK